MNVRIGILFFLLVKTLYVDAQRIDISPAISTNGTSVYDVIGLYGDDLLMYEVKSEEVIVRTFDKKLLEKRQRKLKLLGKKQKFIDLIPGRDHDFYVIYSCIDRKKRKLVVDKFNIFGEQLKRDVLRSKLEKSNQKNYTTVLSENENNLFIYQIESENVLRGVMYNFEQDTSLWSCKVKYDQIKFLGHLEGMQASDYGELFLLFQKYNNKFSRKKHFLELCAIRQNGRATTPIRLKIDSLLYQDLMFRFDNNKRKIIILSTAHREKDNRSEGLHYIRINPYNEGDVRQKFVLYGPILLSDYYRTAHPKNDFLDHIELRHLILRNDGGLLLIGESAKRIERNNYGLAGGINTIFSNNVDYYFEDIFLWALDATGGVHWTKLLRKKQYSHADGAIYSSFGLVQTPSLVRLIFNDEIKKNNTVSAYLLNGRGVLGRQSVMNTQYEGLGLRFAALRQVGSSTFVVPSEVGKEMRLVKFEL